MTLTELQVQLRSIEQSLSVLQTEIEKMKPKASAENKQNFEKITRQAKQFPIENETLLQQDTTVRRIYIAGLSYLLIVDRDGFEEKLLYVCRLSYGVGLSFTAEEIVQLGMQFEADDLENLWFELAKCSRNFLVDGLIVANLTGQASGEVLSLIVDFTKLLGCDKDDLCVASYIAKATLTQNIDILGQVPLSQIQKELRLYRPCIPTAWIEIQRVDCGQYIERFNLLFWSGITDSRSFLLKAFLQSNTVVRKGDPILLFMQFGENKTLFAPADGRVFFINEKMQSNSEKSPELTYVYLASYFDDEKSVREWHKKRHKGE